MRFRLPRDTHTNDTHIETHPISQGDIFEKDGQLEGSVNSESVPTTLRLDIVLWSLGKNAVELIEL